MVSHDNPVWCLGFMSGTSMDGIDAALLKTNGADILEFGPTYSYPYEKAFQQQLLALKGKTTLNESEREVVKEFTLKHVTIFNEIRQLFNNAYPHETIDLMGFHGQTLFHDPGNKFTLQVGDAKLLANFTNVKVVTQFRLNDIENGGQGAPLIPVFHQALAKKFSTFPFLFINIGGVSNITYGDDTTLLAGDCGPGGALIDDACKVYFSAPFDHKGLLAQKGKIDYSLLEGFLKDPFFTKPLPKSLDRDHFYYFFEQVTRKLKNPHDVLATLTMATVKALISSIKRLEKIPPEIFVMGGGAYNDYMMALLNQELYELNAKALRWDLAQKDLSCTFVEAYGFSYLAVRSLYNLSLSFPTTTGVREPLSGGVISYPHS